MSTSGWKKRHEPGRAVACAGLGLAILAIVASGCQRRREVTLVPPDTTRTAAEDSVMVQLREVARMWEGGGDPAEASAATAQVLAIALRPLEYPAWRDRASYLLDSLGVGAELAESRCALAVNLFSRSDPEGGAWPYLYWCSDNGVASQAIEGRSMRLQSLIVRGPGLSQTVSPDSVRLASIVFSRRTSGGIQPLVMTWSMPRKRGARWRLVQTLGADSLGGFGTAGFEGVADTSAELTARAYRTPPGFLECVTCPHVYSTSRFQWTSQGFVRTETQRVSSPYASFTMFIRALMAGDQVAAEDRVADPTLVLEAQRLAWHVSRGPWRPAPGADESPLEMRFFRGQKEAYVVRFRAQGDDWVITGFEPVDRRVE